MGRRALVFALLMALIVPILGIAECVEPCADEEDGGCMPRCLLCTSCTHGPQAIVQPTLADGPPIASTSPSTPHAAFEPLVLADDIFHVPLAS